MEDTKGMALLSACFNMSRQMGKILSQIQLKPGEFFVLQRLKKAAMRKDGADIGRAARLSEFLAVPPPAVTRILNSLEVQGLITRKIDMANRRSIAIDLTTKGEAVLAENEKIVTQVAEELAKQAGGENIDGLIASINSISAFFQALPDAQGGMFDE